MTETTENKGVIYEFGKFVLDPQERILFADGKAIHLTDKVFETLLLLIRHNGRLLTKDEMMASIWEDAFVEESNLARNISRLRKILNTGRSQMIETLPKRGYRFLADVKEINGETSLLVHRQLRVKITQTEEDSTPAPALAPLMLEEHVRRPRWKAGLTAVALILLTGTGVYWYFILSPAKPGATDGLTNLTNNLADDNVPAWSHDGSKIAFTSNRDGLGDIYVMNSDGSTVNRLTFTSALESSSVWSADDSKIVFDSERDGNREIYIMNSDGSDQTRLTFNPTSDVGPVSFSPDGKRIAFSRNAANEGNAAYNYDIYTMNIDGGDVRQVTTDPEFDAEPMWSPDGSRILFLSARDRNMEIYAINMDGSGEVNLSQRPEGNDGLVSFTADGRFVICVHNSSAKPDFNQIWLINADGSNRRQVTSFTDKVSRAAYSPQAKKFAVSSIKGGNFEIYSMDASLPPGD